MEGGGGGANEDEDEDRAADWKMRRAAADDDAAAENGCKHATRSTIPPIVWMELRGERGECQDGLTSHFITVEQHDQ